ncbi:tRNA (adenosine(37)-N6)-threonylcarbamoyltransferase complex transferase subunit TsaD [Fimbriimonas ginsengisoli]|uniref:tRNA N6-adenosine threonylcarbamoyltransferase n=1 Tax=Fimbriimonas ginsengisoli Gsoil 348 TaxID=661478 RepID=A0A068NYC6_FIMGI|nr:tRNA (adenosine(37)-N6)-threonylcarbamoyltransferase complex transferase subunit TsaD [Fimbriimonas ginsengisoli]AIE88015.1 O-sialoglycoprotein endopeptidase [Fimbriimonas ginsengisoli Gsoil 348]
MTLFERPILAIETSCDETSAAVVVGRRVLSNAVASQIALHGKWGGVVPEAAARAHVEALLPTIQAGLGDAGVKLEDVAAIAVTNRPGLVGALSVGVTAAKAIAFSLEVPLIGVHHLEGHLLSVLALPDELPMPHACLIVSGGHTELVSVRGLGDYEIVGETRDDAAGEAFDKGARLLGLGYPGGFAIQEAAKAGDPKRYSLPKGLVGDTIDFSFSGLKTAVLRLVEREGDRLNVADAAASLQETIVSVLTERAMRAVRRLDSRALTLVGGVAANLALRSRLAAACEKEGVGFLTPPLSLCTDNAAMIGLAASYRLARGERNGTDLESLPTAELP